MHINPDAFGDLFEDIKQSSLSHSTCKVVMFVSATDIDALCSARMLSSVFKSELIPHKTVPIVGYNELREMYSALDDDIVNVLCIGCGAIVDLESHFDIVDDEEQETIEDQEQQGIQVDKVESKRKIYVIDSHRPWSLDNLFGSNKVICLDDGSVDERLEREKEAYTQMRYESESDEDDDDEDNEDHDYDINEEEDNEIDIENGEDKPRSDTESDDNEFGESNKENIENQDSIRKSTRKARKARKKRKRENHTVLEHYYSKGNFLSGTSTTQVYSLLSATGNTSVSNLWLAVIGVTSTSSQNPQIYSDIVPVLKDEVSRLCPQSSNGSTTQLVNGYTTTSDDKSLYVETDYAFCLLRHWSLYDSMVHSSYLSAKLELWTEDGRKRLHKMLAKMGISLQESREQWSHMRIDLKRTLREKLAGVSGPFGIEQVIREGIVRKYGFKGSVSAGDAVEAIDALLQGPIEYSQIREDEITEEQEHKEKFWVNNFWDGWDSLGNVNKLLEGIDRAKMLQQVITATGTALFEKKQIKDLRAYRLAVVRDGPDIGLFRNPLALAKLGVWVAEGCAETLKKNLPLVIAALDTISNTYLVLGMGAQSSRYYNDQQANGGAVSPDEMTYNQFGHAFQTTAMRINARVKLDAFESSIIEVAKDDLSRFLEALTLSGLVT